ncbi:acyltransferase [Tenacibaculum sp. A30]|uniref:acyltransferase n=1 Tax=Tenacibaculum sp. A30 TaxID=3442644 RepID=UPI003EB7620E
MRLLKKIIFSFYKRITDTFKWYLFKIAKNWIILNRIHVSLRPFLWRITGCKIGKNVSIGYDVYYDVGNANLITVEDNVWITSRTLLLAHRRDMKDYYLGDDYNKLPYVKENIILQKGCSIGMGSIILPGVTVGEGAIVGAGSVVVKDVPDWTIVVGNPAKVVKKIEERKDV